LIDFWRDLMVVQCAGSAARDLSVPPRYRETLTRQAQAAPLDTLLAGLDILSATKARLRGSNHGRVLVEMALVRLSRLEELSSLTQLAEMLSGGTAAPKPTKPAAPLPRQAGPSDGGKSGASPGGAPGGVSSLRERSSLTPPPVPQEADAPRSPTTLTAETLPAIWAGALSHVGGLTRSQWEKGGIPAISGPNSLVLRFPPEYNHAREHCQQPELVKKVEGHLRTLTGQVWTVRIEAPPAPVAGASAGVPRTDGSPPRSHRQREEAALQQPLVKRAHEVFDALFLRVDEGFGAETPPAAAPEMAEDADPDEA
jgi:DNA polymerase-3 subunit gamma/tau